MTTSEDFLGTVKKDRNSVVLQGKRLASHPDIAPLLKYSPTFTGLVNSARQFVVGNERLIGNFADIQLDSIAGSLPHDVFNCAVELSERTRCGETSHCATCDLNRILSKVISSRTTYKGTATLRGNTKYGLVENFSFLIEAHSVSFEDEPMVLLFMQDVTAFEVKNFMMRLFFHDTLNSLSSMDSLLRLLEPGVEQDPENQELLDLLNHSFKDVTEQVHFYRKLALEAPGSGTTVFHEFSLDREIVSLVQSIRMYIRQNELNITIELETEPVSVRSDKILVRRIILNMLKNAVEASESGSRLSVSIEKTAEYVGVSVKNPGVIPQETRERIFQRGYSTKGSGRGLGTYSMKLLSTRFLSGNVNFTTDEEGTVFTLMLPL